MADQSALVHKIAEALRNGPVPAKRLAETGQVIFDAESIAATVIAALELLPERVVDYLDWKERGDAATTRIRYCTPWEDV